ncbi:hypothetical protein OSB04_016396 [Centaurea solstitialis]|uniref:Uncharacterized protein n=1 Tax=Centaurea solstitialis TaxID=347529 RepID=A0AA38WL10_9ASTR|nr:hypothetical protein OSB04_016396 [Centaurea solstitialis]
MEIEDKPDCHHLHHNSLMTLDLKFLILHPSCGILNSLVLKVIILAYVIQSQIMSSSVGLLKGGNILRGALDGILVYPGSNPRGVNLRA